MNSRYHPVNAILVKVYRRLTWNNVFPDLIGHGVNVSEHFVTLWSLMSELSLEFQTFLDVSSVSLVVINSSRRIASIFRLRARELLSKSLSGHRKVEDYIALYTLHIYE